MTTSIREPAAKSGEDSVGAEQQPELSVSWWHVTNPLILFRCKFCYCQLQGQCWWKTTGPASPSCRAPHCFGLQHGRLSGHCLELGLLARVHNEPPALLSTLAEAFSAFPSFAASTTSVLCVWTGTWWIARAVMKVTASSETISSLLSNNQALQQVSRQALFILKENKKKKHDTVFTFSWLPTQILLFVWRTRS